MTKRETLLSFGTQPDSVEFVRSTSEKKAFDTLLAKIEERFPHLKCSERADDPLAPNGLPAQPPLHSRGRRVIRK